VSYNISVGTDLGLVSGKTLTWEAVVEANLLNRTVLTLDLDTADGLTVNDIEFILVMNIDCAFVAYSTFSHQPDKPKIRIVVPLSRPVSPDEYREVSRDFVSLLPELTFDPCSFVPNQLMYLPACPDLSIACLTSRLISAMMRLTHILMPTLHRGWNMTNGLR
jgi:putative DNA primase/helicase